MVRLEKVRTLDICAITTNLVVLKEIVKELAKSPL